MRLFDCQACGQLIYFENLTCERCARRLGYLPDTFGMSAMEPDGAVWAALAAPGRSFRYCENAGKDACNWLVPAEQPDRFCAACRHNRTVPDLSQPIRLLEWRRMETAKHRLFYQVMRLGLPRPDRSEDPKAGLVFDFLADEGEGAPKVMTGHDDGLITLALSEADDAEREKRRASMHEPYRTLLGHFRHEVGHFYWDQLVRDGGRLDACRAVFGDDEADYAQALQRHYEQGPPADWQQHYVSMYATTHAWEDFAETWAHYLHILDTLDTASAYGLQVRPTVSDDPALHADMRSLDPYAPGPFQRLVEAWLPLTYAMNSLNRSMGLNDLYPFILSQDVIRKLGFIHDLVHRAPGEAGQAA